MIINADEVQPIQKKPERVVVEGYTIPQNTYSEHTQYLKYIDDFPIEKEEDPLFRNRNKDFLRVLSKYPGQSNIDSVDEVHADVIWRDMVFCEIWNTPGMRRRLERLSLKLDHLYSRSRGREGFGSKIQVTTRQEILAKEEKEKQEQKGFTQHFRHKKESKQVIQGRTIQGEVVK